MKKEEENIEKMREKIKKIGKREREREREREKLERKKKKLKNEREIESFFCQLPSETESTK